MRLSEPQIGKISRLILDNLKKKGLIVFKTEEDIVLKRIIDIVVKDMKKEDELDMEVEDIIKRHSNEMDKGRMDYRKMFTMIKNKLANEKGIVL